MEQRLVQLEAQLDVEVALLRDELEKTHYAVATLRSRLAARTRREALGEPDPAPGSPEAEAVAQEDTGDGQEPTMTAEDRQARFLALRFPGA